MYDAVRKTDPELAAVLEAERLGFDSMWTAEAYGSDCLTPLAWWGSRTENIKLGTSIVQMSARTPAVRKNRFFHPNCSWAKKPPLASAK